MNNIELVKAPEILDIGYYGNRYSFEEVENLISKINIVSEDIKGKCLYIENNTISQSKIRDAGFTITRIKSNADIVVISNIILLNSYINKSTNSINYKNPSILESIVDNINNNYKCIYNKDLYKYLYKYEGDYELFKTLDELLESKSVDNIKLAMEMMSNANWENNKLYLIELFNNHWNSRWENCIKNNSYRHSISFKGFLQSLDFSYERLYLTEASDYRNYCQTDEHHQYVFDKYESQFKDKLEGLLEDYKLKLIDIKYEIDKSILTN